MKLAHVIRREAEAKQTLALCAGVVDAEGDVAITVAMRILFSAFAIPGQLDLRIRFSIAQIGEREIGEIESVGDFEIECVPIELERTLQIVHADHCVDELGHLCVPSFCLSSLGVRSEAGVMLG